jgi:CDP-diacylglycerol---serine O-phosphatidyltransferase
MPRERDPDEPKIYFLPNLMTACNLACGFFAILMIFKGQIEVQKMSGELPISAKDYYEISRHYYEYAILLIFGSCLFDLLDGRLARLGGQESPFGQQFDSLADIISFGMAPAMLLSRAVLFPLPGNVGWAIALIYLVCGAMRLARFNCLAAMPKKPGASTDFRGLPIPMAAGFIASLTFLLIDLYKNDHELGAWKYILAGAMLGLSLLMISDVRYPSFKKVGFNTRGTFGAIVAAVLLGFLIVQFRYVMPVVLFSMFLLYGFVRPWVSQKLRKEIEVETDMEDEIAAEDDAAGDTRKDFEA